MQKLIYFSFLFGLLVFPACISNSSKELENSTVETNKNSSKPTDELVENRRTSVEPTPVKADERGKYPTVWIAFFDLSEFNNSVNGFTVWDTRNSEYERLLDEKSTDYKKHGGVEVDLMNCAGYLASGKIFVNERHPDSEAEAPDWRLKVFPETKAKDAEDKIRQCNMPNTKKNISDNNIYNLAFAVAPRDRRRSRIKINKMVDTRGLFASLPENIKKLANSDPQKENLEEQEENNLNLFDDSWSDLDGDGIIDVVLVNGNTAAVILLLVDGKWREIVKIK